MGGPQQQDLELRRLGAFQGRQGRQRQDLKIQRLEGQGHTGRTRTPSRLKGRRRRRLHGEVRLRAHEGPVPAHCLLHGGAAEAAHEGRGPAPADPRDAGGAALAGPGEVPREPRRSHDLPAGAPAPQIAAWRGTLCGPAIEGGCCYVRLQGTVGYGPTGGNVDLGPVEDLVSASASSRRT